MVTRKHRKKLFARESQRPGSVHLNTKHTLVRHVFNVLFYLRIYDLCNNVMF